MDGFTQVKNKRRSRGGGKPNTRKDQVTKEHRPRNPFEDLGLENKDGEVPTEKPVTHQQENLIKIPEEEDM